jgi:hypothetical protein
MPLVIGDKIISVIAGHNEGTMIGVKGDIITIHVVNREQPKLSRETPPYKFLAPYTYEDGWLFKGRDEEVEMVLDTLKEEQVVVVWGKAGVGKTSLLCAGVMPELIEQSPLWVYLSTYNDPINSIRKALAKGVAELDLSIDGELAAPVEELKMRIQQYITETEDFKQLIDRVTSLTDKKITIVLDQFENLFQDSVDDGLRSLFIKALSEAMKELPWEKLGVLIAVDEDDIGRVLVLQSRASPHQLQAANIKLSPLSRANAVKSILEPVKEVGSPDIFDAELVEKTIVPELVRMTPSGFSVRDQAGGLKDYDCVYPPYLQIVCHELWKLAKAYRPPRISSAMYLNARGANGIFANYVKMALNTFSGNEEEKECAKQLLVKMAEPKLKGWVKPERIKLDCLPVRPSAQIFKKLVEAELLSERTVNGQPEYSFSNPIVLEAIRSLWGTHTKQQYLAGDELEHIYSSWLTRREDGETFATKQQLQFLAASISHLALDPVRMLLLLRSAVQTLEPTQPWLNKLKNNEDGKSLLEQLEKPGAKEAADSSSEGLEAKLLLGMIEKTHLDQSQKHNQSQQNGQAENNGAQQLAEPPRLPENRFDTVSKAAVQHEKAAVRQTAALALLPLGSENIVGHLEQELTALEGWQKTKRRVELREVMREADPQMSTYDTMLRPRERRMGFLWRLWRNARRDRVRLIMLTIGGALGAGIALGVLRGVVEKLLNQNAFYAVSNQFFYGCIFGGFTALAVAMAKPVTLTCAQKSVSPQRLFALFHRQLEIVLGTLVFGSTYAAIYLLASEGAVRAGQRASQIAMGFIAGLGLSWGLSGMTGEDASLKKVWALRFMGIAALAFLLTQLFFILITSPPPKPWSLMIVNSSSTYHANVPMAIGDYLDARIPRWSNYLAALDSVVTALVLTAGMRFGLKKASQSLKDDSSLQTNIR